MCFVRSAELMKMDWFKQRKAQLVFIGSGSVQIGKGVAEEIGIYERGAKLFVDDSIDSKVFAAFGATRGVLRTFTLKRWDNYIGLLTFPLETMKGRLPKPQFLERGNKKSENSSGDPFVQGATFVLDDSSNIVFRLIEQSPGFPKADPRKIERAIQNGERYGLVSVAREESSDAKTSTIWKFAFFLVPVLLALLWKRVINAY